MSRNSERAHAALASAPVADDALTLGGEPVARIAERVGRTPFYAYDRRAIGARVEQLRGTLPPGLSLHYAVKANPMPAVVGHLAGLVDGLDVASAGELRVALDAGVGPGDISFAGPGKRDGELRAAVASGITVNAESAAEIERLARVGDALGIQPQVALRVNPDFELKASGMKMGGGPRQFGIDAEIVPEVLRGLGDMAIHFRGFHIFGGSQNLRRESLIETQDATFALARRLAGDAPGPIELLNIGGGFGIPYFPGDEALELGEVSDNLAARMAEWHAGAGDTEIVLELGRYLVGEAGIYVCRVIERKVSRGQVFLVTDGGLHHHLAASGNFGQVLRKNYPVCVAHRVHGGPRENVSVVGPLCTPLDLLADCVDLGRAEPGDLVCVLQSGAYGYSASPHRFLGHPPPLEILV